jgi:hypothetical protein
MQVSPEANFSSLAVQAEPNKGSRHPADLIYQSVTVAAIVLVLGSLWLF